MCREFVARNAAPASLQYSSSRQCDRGYERRSGPAHRGGRALRDQCGEPSQLAGGWRREGGDVADRCLRARHLHGDDIDVDAYPLLTRDPAEGDREIASLRERHPRERHEASRRASELAAEPGTETLLPDRARASL